MKGKLIKILVMAGLMFSIFYLQGCGSNEKKGDTYPKKLMDALDKAEEMDLQVRITQINAALNAYYSQNNQYPENLDLLVPDFVPTQDAICDPWGTRFKIETDSSENLILISAGKDRSFGTNDDIKRRI